MLTPAMTASSVSAPTLSSSIALVTQASPPLNTSPPGVWLIFALEITTGSFNRDSPVSLFPFSPIFIGLLQQLLGSLNFSFRFLAEFLKNSERSYQFALLFSQPIFLGYHISQSSLVIQFHLLHSLLA